MTSATVAALLATYQRCYAQLRSFVQSRVGSPADAADIVQDTYLRLAVRAPAVPVEHAQAYIFRVAGNLAIDHLRHQAMRGRVFEPGEVPESLESGAPGAEAHVLARERLQALLEAVAQLPPRCREVFVLCKLEGLDAGETARRLGISRKLVERQLRKGLLRCQMLLAQRG